MTAPSKTLEVTLTSEGRSISYLVDVTTGAFKTQISQNGAVETAQDGTLGFTDSERQDFALKMYHIILAALRTKSGES